MRYEQKKKKISYYQLHFSKMVPPCIYTTLLLSFISLISAGDRTDSGDEFCFCRKVLDSHHHQEWTCISENKVNTA